MRDGPVDSNSQTPLQAVASYYEARVREFGPTPWGVDWTCEPTQQLRFVQLLKIAGRRRRFSLNDLGCGYGALLPFMRERHGAFADYVGVDVAPGMIEHASRNFADDARAAFAVGSSLPRVADYSVASGVFNVQLGHTPARWRAFVREVLDELHRASRVGFAVNFILPPQRGLVPLQGLFRTRAAPWADYCRRTFGADVEVVESYGLREFTLLVRLSSPARRGASGRAPSSRTAP
jgi:SAM-dependent methyltransferase